MICGRCRVGIEVRSAPGVSETKLRLCCSEVSLSILTKPRAGSKKSNG